MIQYLLVALLCLSCTQQGEHDNGFSEEKKLNWILPNVQGHWKLHDTKIVKEVPFLNLQTPEPDPMDMITEDSPWDYYHEFDLVFEKDSMYKINYPIQAYPPVHYFLDTGYMHVGSKDGIYAYPAELVNDTLYLYTPIPDYGYFKESYVPANFNDSILNVLKMYGINYPELSGTWMLVREDDFDYGTHYELNFPYTIPDSIEFSREQMIAALGNEKIYMMSTDGVKRDYSFSFHGSCIYFEPGKWCKEENPLIYFYRK